MTRPDGSKLTGPVREHERHPGFRAVGVAASRLAFPIIGKRGGGILVRLKSEWAAIVGPDWANVTWPSTLGRDGALKLRTTSGAALEAQHRAPLLIERINGFFGRTVVSRLALVQGPLPLPAPLRAPPLRPLESGEKKALDDRLVEIADPELRQALAGLGGVIIATNTSS